MGDAAQKLNIEQVQKLHWLDTAEAATYLRTTPGALYMLVARGKIVPDAPGGRGRFKGHRFSKATLDAFMTGGGHG